MMAPDTVETARLRGERLAFRHWDLWRRMGEDPRLMATLGGVWTEAQAREKLEWNCRHWEEHGHGQWLFFMKDSARFVGRCGIRKMVVNAKAEVELGYSVLPELWGHGFAPEMGATALHVAFEQFGYPSVVAFALVNNVPSERVMRKLGFSFEDHIIHAGQRHVLYRRRNPNPAMQPTAKEPPA
ncbi:MAG TPA: GNAT family N-acetyltransferase [Candidatus Methylomirabilis sp.]|nr:GNAT family N-acetyltransferase [Candidatus Methylomirabilis sp.]